MKTPTSKRRNRKLGLRNHCWLTKLDSLLDNRLLLLPSLMKEMILFTPRDVGFDSEDESGNEATSSSVRDSDPMKGDVLKDKTSGFRDSPHKQFKGLISISRKASPPQREDISSGELLKKRSALMADQSQRAKLKILTHICRKILVGGSVASTILYRRRQAGKRLRDDAGDEAKSHKKKHKKRKQEKVELWRDQRRSRVEEERRLDEMRAHGAGASSRLAPKADEHTNGVTVSSESQTLLTPPISTEFVPSNTMSTPVTIGSSVEVPRITSP
ncbi:hypothetical protein HAX54_025819 [Datura stramonium]|uniref:Uncharacterized protein n=1 Tax=Datura stramonium TaxID=4076 RepID=A0ABS8V074_DATST|nr:hypothetical protein [Datura stramonium]